ncbi:MAG: hypothetical protein K0V04_21875 [Deltaproteobacteria bacterium]|nr:hypothetical protein [Deltaproteobacteria bacterium]
MTGETDERGTALETSEIAAEESFDRSSAADAEQSCRPASTWVDIKLVDEEGAPIPGARFEVLRPDGTRLGEGRLGRDGCGGFENIDQLDYTVCFPDLDEDAWAPTSESEG